MIMREEGLTPSRRPFENGTKKTHIIFQINEHAFIYLFSNQNDMHNLLRISGLFKRRSAFVRDGLKMTPI